MFWTTGWLPPALAARALASTVAVGIVTERFPFKPPGVEPLGIRPADLIAVGVRPVANLRVAGRRESDCDPGVPCVDHRTIRCRNGAGRRLVAEVDRGRFNERPVGKLRSSEVRSYPEAGGSLPIKSADGDPPVTAPCCLGIHLRTSGRQGTARIWICAAEIVTNGESRSARPRRVEPRQVDFSVAATDMANSLDPEAGRRRAGLRVGRHGPRRQHPGTDTENGEKAGRCLKRSDLAAPEREVARHDSREREEPVALECRQGDSPWRRGAQAAPTERRIKVRGRFDGVAERQADSATVERFSGRALSGRGGIPEPDIARSGWRR